MSGLIDLAIGSGCHFCNDARARNTRVRRQQDDGLVEELAVPLCDRHRIPLEAAGAAGRLHKPTGVRWWSATVVSAEAAGAVCPAATFVKPDGRGEG